MFFSDRQILVVHRHFTHITYMCYLGIGRTQDNRHVIGYYSSVASLLIGCPFVHRILTKDWWISRLVWSVKIK